MVTKKIVVKNCVLRELRDFTILLSNRVLPLVFKVAQRSHLGQVFFTFEYISHGYSVLVAGLKRHKSVFRALVIQ